MSPNNNLIKKHVYYNNAFFARWAKLYDYEKYFMFPLRRYAASLLQQELEGTKKLLDIAAGTGAQAYEFAKHGHTVIGIDLSPEMLAQAKKKIKKDLKLSFQVADGTKLPFKDKEFDVSSVSLGLHDMPYEIGVMVLKEMKRVTKKGGDIVIVEYMEPKNHPASRIAKHIILLYETPMYKHFIHNTLDKYLKEAGLQVHKKRSFLGLFQVVHLKNN